MLKFNDDINIDTTGQLRKLKLKDGWYVVGENMLLPVDSEEEAIKILNIAKRRKPNAAF